MLRVPNLKIPLDGDETAPLTAALKKLHIEANQVFSWRVSKKSVDARDKDDVHFVMTVDVAVRQESAILKKLKPGTASMLALPPRPPRMIPKALPLRPVVVGLGPGGLFAGLLLARAGTRPLVLERGESVERRARTTEIFAAGGELNPESNIQFGEGGAGAFSDGKLTTGIKDPHCETVLRELFEHGAPEEILYEAHPHIGTDRLPGVVAAIRKEIEKLGGEVRFNTRLTDIITQKGQLTAIRCQDEKGVTEVATNHVILAIGHSAADTQQMLYRAGINMIQKPFSIGVRIEHPQRLINQSQWGKFAAHPALGAAEYHLATHLPDGRGAYTFCMCPGGTVVPASSRLGGLCVNGMSTYARDGKNANAALLVDVRTEDFGDDHPLAGYVFQRIWEEKAFRAGGENYHAPAQRVEDFLQGKASTRLGDVKPSYRPGVTCSNLKEVLPSFAYEGLQAAIMTFDRQLKGFAMPDAVMTGVETRSSCPVRLLRDERYESNVRGVYPCGEGAGYAGGIMSAAVDGMRVAEAVLRSCGIMEED